MDYKTTFDSSDELRPAKVVKRSRTVTTTSQNNESSESSSSYPSLEKKTTEIIIYENYNFTREIKKLCAPRNFSYNNPKSIKDKPVIEVTVTQSDTHQERREKNTKSKRSDLHFFRSTTARQTKLSSELRASASTSFSKADRTNNDNFITVSDIKSVIESLNMDRKKKKVIEKDKKLKKETIYQQDAEEKSLQCNCSPTQCSVKSGEGGRSRVRITGRLGLTEDDKYVLKCAATIDGQPIDTNFSRSLSPNIINKNDRDPTTANIGECWPFNCPRLINGNQKNIQAQTEPIKVDIPNTHDAVYYNCRKCSQATQVNLKFLFTNCDNVCTCETVDKGVQCGCNVHNLITDTIHTTERGTTKMPAPRSYRNSSSLKASDDSNLQIVKDIMKPMNAKPRTTGRSNSPPVLSRKDENEVIQSRKLRTKSSSPVRNSGDGQSLGRPKSDTKVKAQRPISPSPVRKPMMNSSSTGVAPKKPHGKMARTNMRPKKVLSPESLTTNSGQSKKSGKKSNASVSRKSETIKAASLKASIKSNKSTQRPKKSAKGKKSTLQEQPSEPTIDRKQAKKLLVNKFTNNLEPKTNTKKSESKKKVKTLCSCGNNVSNISINIEGDSEYYDLLFQKNCQTTGLTVRKKTKSRNKSPEKESDLSLSMENFLMNPEQNRKRSFSQTLVLSESEGNVDTKPPVRPITSSVVKVRDSIEIKHIRESRNSGGIISDKITMNGTVSPQIINKDFYPVQRDPELRNFCGAKANPGQRNPCRAKTKPTGASKAKAQMESSPRLAFGKVIRKSTLFPFVTNILYTQSTSLYLQSILYNNVVFSIIHIQSENESTNEIIVFDIEKDEHQELLEIEEDTYKPIPLPVIHFNDSYNSKEEDAHYIDANESHEDISNKLDKENDENLKIETLESNVKELQGHCVKIVMDSVEYQMWQNKKETINFDEALNKGDQSSFVTKSVSHSNIYSSSSYGDCSCYSGTHTKYESCGSVSMNSESGDFIEANSDHDHVASQRQVIDHSSEDETKESRNATKGNYIRSFQSLFRFLTRKS